MRVLSRLGAATVAALLWTAMAVAAAPAQAGVDGGATAPAGAAARADGQDAAGKGGAGQPLVLPGRAANGVATVITCYVNGVGPTLTAGTHVGWTIIINCVGGTPQYLSVYMDLARYTGVYSYVIEAAWSCERHFDTILTCAVVAPCFQAGAEYDGYADLYGIDENAQLHRSWFAVPRTWVGCVI